MPVRTSLLISLSSRYLHAPLRLRGARRYADRSAVQSHLFSRRNDGRIPRFTSSRVTASSKLAFCASSVRFFRFSQSGNRSGLPMKSWRPSGSLRKIEPSAVRRDTVSPSFHSGSKMPSSVISHPQMATRYASKRSSAQYCHVGMHESEYFSRVEYVDS